MAIGEGWLDRVLPAIDRDPTHALFANQSHSIPDNIMALFGLIGAWNYSTETARSAVGGSPRGGFESAPECAN